MNHPPNDSKPQDIEAREPTTPTLFLPLPPPIVFLLPYAVGVGLHFVPSIITLPIPSIVGYIVGPLIIVLAVLLLVWTGTAFKRHQQHPNYRLPTTAIVQTGPYAYTRNPFYLVFAVIGVGIALTVGSLTMLVAVPIGALALDLVVIKREERYLTQLFGREYLHYQERVRRWI